MSLVIPNIFKLGDRASSDITISQRKYIICQPRAGTATSSLNDGTPITFDHSGDNRWYSLSDPESGFWTTIGFITKSGNEVDGVRPNNRDANITLANMWWAHMFDSASFRLGSTTLEQINNFGVAIETLAQLYGEEFRKESGEYSGFIPDTGTGAADSTPLKGTVTVTANNAATPIGLAQGNEGHSRRLHRYNYTVANNDTVRTVQVFIPLRMIFNCCTVQKLLKGVPFYITLNRKATAAIENIFFGAANTSVQFNGLNGTGITQIILQLVEIIPHPGMAKHMEDYISKPDGQIEWLYRNIECNKVAFNSQPEFTTSLSRVTHPDGVLVVAKGASGAASQRGLDKNFSLCRHADVSSIIVEVDSTRFPDLEQDANFKSNIFAKFYQQLKSVCRINRNECALSPSNFEKLYTIFAVDCTAHSPKLGKYDVNVRVKRIAVPDDENSAVNPRTLDWYFITLSGKAYLINCIDKSVTEVF